VCINKRASIRNVGSKGLGRLCNRGYTIGVPLNRIISVLYCPNLVVSLGIVSTITKRIRLSVDKLDCAQRQ